MRALFSRNIADRIIKPCADPGIFARGSRPDSQKTALTTFFGLIIGGGGVNYCKFGNLLEGFIFAEHSR